MTEGRPSSKPTANPSGQQPAWRTFWPAIASAIVVALVSIIARLPVWASLVLAGLAGGIIAGACSYVAPRPGEAQATRRQRMRSVAIALALGGMVLLFYVATIVRLGGQVMNRPL